MQGFDGSIRDLDKFISLNPFLSVCLPLVAPQACLISDILTYQKITNRITEKL